MRLSLPSSLELMSFHMTRLVPLLATCVLIALSACASDEPDAAGETVPEATAQAETEEANKRHVRRFFEEVWSTGDVTLRDSFLAADYRGHVSGSAEPLNREGWWAWFTGFREAFPDARFTVEDMVAEGDLVAARLTMRGTHRGELNGIAPTGREVTVTGMSIERIVDGRIVEGWNENDALGMLGQLGALPPPSGQ
jgi:predicted ester cyclase